MGKNTDNSNTTYLVSVEFDYGEEVYLKTDPDGYKRIVTGFRLRPGTDVIEYGLSLGESETWHYGIEITRIKPFDI